MKTVTVDPATGDYVTYDEQGNEIGRTPRAEMLSGLGGGNTASGNTTAIDAQGKAVNPVIPASDPMAPASAPAPAATGQAPAAPGSTPRSSYTPRSYGSRSSGYSGGGGGSDWYDSSYGGSDPFAGGGYSEPVVARYADGSTHPSQGGAPRTPGGMWNTQQEDGGYDSRQQVHVPGGASAGPFEVSAAPNPTSSYNGGGYGGGGGAGGGGGSGYGANSAIGQKLEAKVRGMAAKISGGGGSSSSTTTDPTKAYRRQGRRTDRAYDRYNEQLAHPKPLPVRGWVKEQGYKPGSVAGLLDEPGAIYATEHNLNQFTDHLTDLPMTDLAMMTAGTQGRNLLSRTPVTKVPGVLRKAGVKPTKPEYKRTLDPSKVANKIAQMYGNVGAMNTADLLQNLAGATKNSAVRQGLRQQFEYDPGQAFDQMENYVQAASQMNANRGTGWAADHSDSIHRRMLEMAPEILGTKPKHADRAIQKVANEFL